MYIDRCGDIHVSIYEAVGELPLVIEDDDFDRRERDTSSDFTRVTTVVTLRGDECEGRGEDVTYEAEAHDVLLHAPLDFDLSGEYTLRTFADYLDTLDLFPTRKPERAAFRHYRRWAFESAALDLALRQANTYLGAVLDRSYDPVRFVTSARLGDPPTADRVHDWLTIDPSLEFKLDATPDWPDDVIDDLAATDRVRILDLKAYYDVNEVATHVDPAFYRKLLTAFPEAVIEDAGVSDETNTLLATHVDRLSWDLPIEGLGDLEDLPWEPRWLNIKPSRFGSLASLFETIEYALDHDVALYGGGQFELGPGRGQIQLLASLFYPDTPNDVAPGAYNDPEPRSDVPASPLEPPRDPRGFRWG